MLHKKTEGMGMVNSHTEERNVDMLNPNNVFDSMPNLIGKPAVAKMLGCSVRLVDDLRKKKNLPAIRIGGLVKFDPLAIARWRQQQEEKGGEA